MRDCDHVLALAMAVAASAVLLVDTPVAEACGCLSPPAVSEGEFAVNQQSEQIIFEVEPGWVTAHVLIKYAGDPAAFAWIIPVPEIPELGISPVSAFGLLDKLTAPQVDVFTENVCPISQWACAYHQPISCGNDDSYGFGSTDAGSFGDAGAAPGDTGVTVISEQVVGDYQTVIFRASEAQLATDWLRNNGFIVNQTTSIYMESYVQANMVFVAAKLVPGAGIKAIKPLRMRYRAAYPQIPLVLTAVAAEPHLTVSAFIYGNKAFRPLGHPEVTINRDSLARDNAGRLNYPMVLARAVDEAGGDGFAIEYRGLSVAPSFGSSGFCCDVGEGGYDRCGLGNDSQCQCPRDGFDRTDCSAQGDLIQGVELLDALAARHTTLTRITTRISAEEMTFDPQFEPYIGFLSGRMSVSGTQPSLDACSTAVIDKAAFAEVVALEGCASLYCGTGGQCVGTQKGAACACDAGFVAHRFTDLDGEPSVTCIPAVPPVDLRAEGQVLPDACAAVSCGDGTCIDRNGIAVCACQANAAAIAGTFPTPRCAPITHTSLSPGAQDYSEPLRTLDVCAPPPPSCGSDGWLVRTPSARPGVDCGDTQPAWHQTRAKPAPTCGGVFSCSGCQETSDELPIAGGVIWFLVAMVVRRRRRR